MRDVKKQDKPVQEVKAQSTDPEPAAKEEKPKDEPKKEEKKDHTKSLPDYGGDQGIFGGDDSQDYSQGDPYYDKDFASMDEADLDY